MTALPAGIVRGMPAEKYHADPGVSNSMLSSMAKSPAHCYALHLDPNRPERAPTAAMAAGTLAHTMILEPGAFAERYAVKPAGLKLNTKDGMAWRDDVAPGLTIISEEEYATGLAQRTAVMRLDSVRRLMSEGIAEASVFWTDPDTGLRCRCRHDWLHFRSERRVVALDIKTISDLTDSTVERAVTTYGYHRQAAHYTAGLEAVGLDVEAFGFVFVSGSYPFLAAPYLLDDETASQGAEEVAELLGMFKSCQLSGEWPLYGDGFRFTGLQKWARRSQEVEVSFVED